MIAKLPPYDWGKGYQIDDVELGDCLCGSRTTKPARTSVFRAKIRKEFPSLIKLGEVNTRFVKIPTGQTIKRFLFNGGHALYLALVCHPQSEATFIKRQRYIRQLISECKDSQRLSLAIDLADKRNGGKGNAFYIHACECGKIHTKGLIEI